MSVFSPCLRHEVCYCSCEHISNAAQKTDPQLDCRVQTITAQLAKEYAESEFEKFRPRQDLEYHSDFDREVKKLQTEKPKTDVE